MADETGVGTGDEAGDGAGDKTVQPLRSTEGTAKAYGG
jgi:hypothetical protein